MAVRKTSVAVDEELLEEVKQELHTTTLRETVERAFLEILRQRARRAEILALTGMGGLDLAKEDVMAGAWRE